MDVKAIKKHGSMFRHYCQFSKEEIQAFMTAVVIMGFIISFNKWGEGTVFSAIVGVKNFLLSILIAAIILGTHLFVIKRQAINWGYRAEFKIWWYGLIVGLGLVFFSAALTSKLETQIILWLLIPGGILFHHVPARALGRFRYGINTWEIGLCVMMGSLTTIGLAIIFKILLIFFPGSEFFYHAMNVSLWYAFFSMIPFPPLNGAVLYFASRITWGFIFGLVVGFNLLLRFNMNLFLIIILSAVIALVIWVWNIWKFEDYF